MITTLGSDTCEIDEGCRLVSGASFSTPEPGNDALDGKSHVVVRTPSGELYGGDLIQDILEYRKLRALQLAEGTNDETLTLLEERLRAVPREDGGRNVRAYHRFDVVLRAKLRQAREGQAKLSDVETINVSAGGVKITLAVTPAPGEQVWLLLPQDESLIILPARVAWARENAAGLMFAGAPTTRPLRGKRR